MKITLLVILCSCLMWQVLESQMIYKLKKVDCRENPVRLKNVSCRLKAINWNVAIVNMDCDLFMPIVRPVIRVQVLKKDYSNQFQPFLIDVKFGFCEVVEKRSYFPYALIVWKLFKRYTNVNHSCPFSGHLSTRDGILGSEILPPFPEGLFEFRFTFWDTNSTNTEHLGTVKLFIQVMEAIRSKRRPPP
ncbi:uncharacterized protein LOC120284483 [Drosophila simulans]|uniref:uncharacterized protein LOC120284483 n=1 Tax=Drosophila simulans TaxID=7240 RepID=UPI00192CE922|nr:uncharacterized protein LOC120284483 [Drosophila simulans]